jgi:hypothetical protein
MNNLQKMGGAAALVEAATYLVGIVIAFTILAPTWEFSAEQTVAFLVENQTFMHLWHLIIYVVNGIFLVVLVLALYERLKGNSPALAQVASAIGLIWAGLVIASGLLIINDLGVIADLYGQDPAQATTVWLALSAVESGLGGAVELPGGLWLLLVSWAAWRGNELPKMLNYLGVLIGTAGVVTAVPTLGELGAVFGLGSIVWFIWLGIVMLRTHSNTMAEQPGTFTTHHNELVD